ncbi:MAG: MATE family efflux transporter [Candidatus Binatia bacterium]
MLAQPPLRTIISLAAPTTAVMLMAAGVNVLQTYFVSRLGDEAIAALALVFPIALVLFTVLSNGLAAGVSAAIARALGGGRTHHARELAEQALTLTVLLALAGTLLSELGCEAILRAMGGRGTVLAQAVGLGRILFGGLLIMLVVGTIDGILRAGGNVRVAALGAAISMILQVAFTPLLMFRAGFGLNGAPLAMLGGQLVGLIPRAVCLFGGYAPLRPSLTLPRLRSQPTAEILRVALPAALTGGLSYLGLIVLTGVLARYGDDYLAAYGLGTRLDFLIFSLGLGISTAALTLVGMAAGAGRPELIERYVLQCSLLAVAVSAPPALLVTWQPSLWLGLFTDSADIHRIGASYFRLVAPSYMFGCVSIVIAAAFQGLRRAAVPMTVIGVRALCVIALALFLSRRFQVRADLIFALIGGGYIAACAVLIYLFRAAMRARA